MTWHNITVTIYSSNNSCRVSTNLATSACSETLALKQSWSLRSCIEQNHFDTDLLRDLSGTLACGSKYRPAVRLGGWHHWSNTGSSCRTNRTAWSSVMICKLHRSKTGYKWKITDGRNTFMAMRLESRRRRTCLFIWFTDSEGACRYLVP